MTDVAEHVRTRTITWHDPVATASRALEMSGMEYLEAIAAGELPPPPIAELMDMRPVELDRGRVVFEAHPAEFHYNPIGVVHGGLAATLLDSAMGCAVQTLLDAGEAYTTLEVKVNYVRPMTRETGRVLAEASVVHRGGRTATAEARLVSEETGKLLAHATTTCLVWRL